MADGLKLSPAQAGSPAERTEWPAVVSLAVTTFVLVTTEFVPAGLLPAMAADYGVSEGRAGLLVTVPGMVAAVSAPASAVACARIDRRLILLTLTLLLATSNAVVALSTHFSTALLGRVLLGIGVGGYWTIGGSLGPRLVPGRRSVRATALILSGIAFGSVAGVPAGTFLGGWYGWRFAFWATAGVALATLVAQCLVIPRLPGASGATLGRLRSLLRLRAVRVGLAATALTFVGHFGAYTYVAPLLNRVSAGGAAIGTLLLVFGAGTILGNMAGPRAVGTNVRSALVAAVGGVGFAVLVLAAAAHEPAVVAVSIAVWGFSYGVLPVALQTWMFRAYPDGPESVTSLYVCVAQVSIGSGSFLGGTAFDGFGATAPFWLGGLSAFVAIPLVIAAGPIRSSG